MSCNCRATTGEHSKAGKLFYEPMDGEPVREYKEARARYNDPANHNAVFTEEDKLRG